MTSKFQKIPRFGSFATGSINIVYLGLHYMMPYRMLVEQQYKRRADMLGEAMPRIKWTPKVSASGSIGVFLQPSTILIILLI